MKDPTGKNLTVQLAASPQLVNPSASVTFQPGVTKIYTINATGLPTPAITLQGNLPPGFRFGDNGRGQAIIVDTNTSSKGNPPVSLTVTATNIAGTARQTLSFTQNAGSATLSIDGPTSVTLQGEQPFSLAYHIVAPNLFFESSGTDDRSRQVPTPSVSATTVTET